MLAGILDLPPLPRSLRNLVNEVEALVDGFTDELLRHTRALVSLLSVLGPERERAIVRPVRSNPGHARPTLGEALCVWWLGRVLEDREGLWRGTRGLLKVGDIEIDVLSVLADDEHRVRGGRGQGILEQGRAPQGLPPGL